MALEDSLSAIRLRISKVQVQKARAQVEGENARIKLSTAKQVLKEEFGVITTADAKKKLSELEAELEAAVTSVEADLEAAGA